MADLRRQVVERGADERAKCNRPCDSRTALVSVCRLSRGEEAYRLAKMAREGSLEAQAAGTIGNAWFNMGEIAEAIEWYEHNVEILRKLGSEERTLGTGLANLGNAYGASGDLVKALDCFREGVEL